jgi:hypothetical protein
VFTDVPIFSFGCIQDVHGTLFSGYCEKWFASILGACELRLLHNVNNSSDKNKHTIGVCTSIWRGEVSICLDGITSEYVCLM